MDFSTAFKNDTRRGKGKKKKKKAEPVLDENGEVIQADPLDDVNRDLEDDNILHNEIEDEVIEIPRDLKITQNEMRERKFMDQRRWFCMARPQYPKSCGISSLVSCWNYLFSTLGAGSHRPISTEEALEVLGFKPPYNNVSFGLNLIIFQANSYCGKL